MSVLFGDGHASSSVRMRLLFLLAVSLLLVGVVAIPEDIKPVQEQPLQEVRPKCAQK